jgi:hypothetical protein
MNILSGLTLAFIVLKVFKIIDCNWCIVVSPAIIEVLIFGGLIWLFKRLMSDD